MITIEFENDFQQKLMAQSFKPGSTLASIADVTEWRSQWMQQLKSWHSPYKVVVDLSHLQISPDLPTEVKAALDRMVKFFEGFFLKKIVGFGNEPALFSFLVFATADLAYSEIGIRERKSRSAIEGDFRSAIQIENHFRQHSVEVTFLTPVQIDSLEKLQIMRDKLTNNLMQWHSKWNLMIDCQNLVIAEAMHADFSAMGAYFKGLFLKKIVGYGVTFEKSAKFPFEHYRARHKAAAMIDAEGFVSGDDAICKTKSKTDP